MLGRLLIKTDQSQSLSHERSLANQRVDYRTARNITSNSEQKEVVRSWKIGGGDLNFKGKREEWLLRNAADIAGIDQNVLTTTLGPNKMQVGAGRVDRWSIISAGGAGIYAGSAHSPFAPIPRANTQNSAPNSTPQGTTPQNGTKNGTNGKGGKEKGKEKGKK